MKSILKFPILLHNWTVLPLEAWDDAAANIAAAAAEAWARSPEGTPYGV